jgi:hypothetical protein
MEEALSERCLAAGLHEKAWSHRFSAASCWAQAGNFYQAIAWCDDLLAQTGSLTPSAAGLKSMSNNSALAGHAGMPIWRPRPRPHKNDSSRNQPLARACSCKILNELTAGL